MELTDDKLLELIAINQLKILPMGVLNHYIGNRWGVVGARDYDFCYSVGSHIMSRCSITKELGAQQLRKRILKLIKDEKLKTTNRGLTFYIDSEFFREAFTTARKYWKKEGVPEGITNGKCNCIGMPCIQSQRNVLLGILNKEYASNRTACSC